MVKMSNTRNDNSHTIFQPFSSHPKKNPLVLSICVLWVVCLCVAFLPLLEYDGNVYYQSVVVKNSPYFKTWDINFNTLKSFAIKLFTFHPDLRNASTIEKGRVINSTSWKELDQFIGDLMPGSTEIGSYNGYVAIYLF